MELTRSLGCFASTPLILIFLFLKDGLVFFPVFPHSLNMMQERKESGGNVPIAFSGIGHIRVGHDLKSELQKLSKKFANLLIHVQ